MLWAAAAAIGVVAILFFISRKVAYVVFAATAVIGCIAWVITKEDSTQKSNEKQAVTGIATIDAEACPDPGRPITIEFRNDGNRPVERLSFELTARLKGHSSVAYRAFLRSDKIIEPGQASTTCYGVLPHGFAPPRPETIDFPAYDWAVDISLVGFAP